MVVEYFKVTSEGDGRYRLRAGLRSIEKFSGGN
jgi:hypothetical protein